MKTLLALLLLFPSLSWGLEKEDCQKMASDSLTSLGMSFFMSTCYEEIEKGTFWFNRTKTYKCAKKSLKKPSDTGLIIYFKACMGKDYKGYF
jgi:hypothetical protein